MNEWMKAEDTRANSNSWETHLVRKSWAIGLLRALSPGFMMTMMEKWSNIWGSYVTAGIKLAIFLFQREYRPRYLWKGENPQSGTEYGRWRWHSLSSHHSLLCGLRCQAYIGRAASAAAFHLFLLCIFHIFLEPWRPVIANYDRQQESNCRQLCEDLSRLLNDADDIDDDNDVWWWL